MSPVQFCVILASVIIRGLPWTTIASYIDRFRQHGIWGRVRTPKFLGRYLPKIEVPSAVLSNFSFRHLPSASVGPRGLPSPHIFPNSDKTVAFRDSMGADVRFLPRGGHLMTAGRRRNVPRAPFKGIGRPGKPFSPESWQSPRYGSREFLRAARIGYDDATVDRPRVGELASHAIVGLRRFTF